MFKRYKVIACEIMYRELCHCAANVSPIVDITFMPKGLHDIGSHEMRKKLQHEIDIVDEEKYDAILLAYALCNNGIVGLRSKLPLVIPKAHDCITLLMGSREKYNAYFRDKSFTFFKSPGWIERDVNPGENKDSITSKLGISATFDENLEKFGEENAEFLDEMLGHWLKNYKSMAFIDTKVGDSKQYELIAKQQADEQSLEFDRLEGDTNLLFRLLNGDWDDNYVVVPAGNDVIATNDKEIISYTSE